MWIFLGIFFFVLFALTAGVFYRVVRHPQVEDTAEEILIDIDRFKYLRNSIPTGPYCHGENGLCPFWDIDVNAEEQDNGYCHLLQIGDSDDGSFGLLWDQCKACDINFDDDFQ